MRDVQGGTTTKVRWALGATLALVAACALQAGAVHAQDPPAPTYDIPTPTPTPSPIPTASPTPFQDPPQVTPPARPRLMRPFPVVRTTGSYTRTRTRFRRIVVRAPAGARIDARCSKRRCRTTRRTLTRERTVRLGRLQRSYKPRTRITIRVTAPGVIGKHVEIRTRKGKRPLRRDRCLQPDRRAPSACGDA